MPDTQHKSIQGERGAVHYWVAGQGEHSIVFTHGATMDHGLFQYQVDYFSQRYRAITWDAPLHGLSRPYTDFSLGNAAVELVRILDAEVLDRAHLVGQSMGGFISQIAARDYPDRVLSLTAVDSSPIQGSYYSALDNWLLAITPPLLRLYPYNTLINSIAKQIALHEPARAYALETLKGYTKEEIAHIMGQVYQGLQAYKEDFRLPFPLLIVVGEEDRTGKVRAYSARWAKEEKRSLKVIPDAAHNANMDNPAAFNRVLDEFLRAVVSNEDV